MSGVELSPEFAADLASNVYGIKEALKLRLFAENHKDVFDLSGSSFAQGRTGGHIVNTKHVMALLCVGKGNYKGQAFVAIKGTASLYDVLTDLNAGLRTSHTGFPVHQGFYYAFDSILADLMQFASNETLY